MFLLRITLELGGYCTRVSFAIEELKKQTNDAVVIAIHQGDPMQFGQVSTLMNSFVLQGFLLHLLIDRADGPHLSLLISHRFYQN